MTSKSVPTLIVVEFDMSTVEVARHPTGSHQHLLRSSEVAEEVGFEPTDP
jgi:hypothetical protein